MVLHFKGIFHDDDLESLQTCSTIYSMTQYFQIIKQIPGAKWWMMIDIRYQRLWLDAGTSTLTHQKWLYLAGWAAAPML